MTQAERTEAAIAALDGQSRYDQVFNLCAHARDLAKRLDSCQAVTYGVWATADEMRAAIRSAIKADQ